MKNGNLDFFVMTSCGSFRQRERMTLQTSCGAERVKEKEASRTNHAIRTTCHTQSYLDKTSGHYIFC